MNNEIDLKGEIDFVIMYSKIKKDLIICLGLKNLYGDERYKFIRF